MVQDVKEIGALFEPKPTVLDACIPLKEIKLKFCNIRYKLENASTKNGERKYILKNVSGEFQSGSLSAIIGPSGAGKTTFLNLLSGFVGKGVEGNIFVNGEKQNVPEFRKISSYIPQEFAILDNITAKETLKFSADFKLGIGKKMNEEKSEKINHILKLLNLEKCKDTMVSRLSGGERKRLSIAVELITNPPVMFFDEPTSGLDSVASMQVLSHLKELATDGRAIICVIHQPSSKILKLFDDVLVLSDGESIYCGPLNRMVDDFEEAGFHCPNFYNRADFALEVASKELNGDLGALIYRNDEKFGELEEISIRDANEECSKNNIQEGTCDHIKKMYFLKNFQSNFKPTIRKYPVGSVEQFSILVKRNILAMSRDVMTIQLRVIMHIITALAVGAVFYDVGDDTAKIPANASFLFFTNLFLFFANAMPTVLSCPLETKVFLREHFNGWYTIKAYFLSKFVADLPVIFICPTLYCGMTYYMTGQPDDLGRYLMFWGLSVLITVEAQTLGLCFGSSFDMKMSMFLVPSVCMPMLIFCGFFIRYRDLSDYCKPFMHISSFRYSLEGLIQSIYGYNRTDLECSEIYCFYKSADHFLNDFSIGDKSYGTNVLAIIIFILALKICFLISLYVRIRKGR